MNITREDLPGRQVALTIELDAETVNSGLDRAYRQMVNQVNIPGFRRGKAPRYILESYVGKESLTERAVRNILPATVEEALKDQEIDALDVGDVEIVSLDPVQVRVIIVQPPKIEVGDYGTIRVEKEAIEITDEDVDRVLDEMRRDGAPWNEPTEARPLREGDMVYLNLEGFSTEGELPEAKRENFPTIVSMERGGVPMAVSEALVGMSVGEEKDVTDTLPDDYPNEALRGRDISYHVQVVSMKEQQLPELDDEWAKTTSNSEYETVGALREAVDASLKRRAEESAQTKQVNEIVKQIVDTSNVEVPESLVNEELNSMLSDLENRVKQQRLTLRNYFTYAGTSEAEWRERNRERAHERVVRTLVLQDVARREGVEVEDEEIEREMQTMLGRFEGDERQEAERVLGMNETRSDLQDRIYQEKLVQRLVAIAEGREEAAPAPAQEPPAPESEGVEGGEEEEAAAGGATELEEAGGAAELLGTEGTDTSSHLETGEAEGGGTPKEAPRLDG